MLARSGNKELAALAGKELESPSESHAQVALAQVWWKLASKEKGTVRESMQLRATHWYSKAVAGLSGLSKTEYEKRLNEAPWRYLSKMDEYDAVVGYGWLGKGDELGHRRKGASESRKISVEGLAPVQRRYAL